MSVEQLEQKIKPISIEDRRLSDLRHLFNHYPGEGGLYEPHILRDIEANYKTATQESVPHVIAKTYHEVVHSGRQRLMMWMGKTAVENAESGYKFHISEEARARIPYEVDEGHHAQDDLELNIFKLFISPKMSDVDYETAKKDHLADDDAVRGSWLETDDEGNVTHRVMESLLVKDVPLNAWVKMLQDPKNIFGKAFQLDEPKSSLSIMKIHREFELPLGELKDGILDVIRAVAGYIDDDESRASVKEQIKMFESDQDVLDEKADYYAKDWLNFDLKLVESLKNGKANFTIESFVRSMQHQLTDEDIRVIDNHTVDGDYIMTWELASVIEKIKQNTLWSRIGVLSGDKGVIDQIDSDVRDLIIQNEEMIYLAHQRGLNANILIAENNRLIAQQNISVGNGCNGVNSDTFNGNSDNGNNVDGVAASSESDWKNDPSSWKSGICIVKTCPTPKKVTMVGPCSVCKACQAKYDTGNPPAEEPPFMDQLYKFLAEQTEKEFALA